MLKEELRTKFKQSSHPASMNQWRKGKGETHISNDFEAIQFQEDGFNSTMHSSLLSNDISLYCLNTFLYL